MKGDYEALLGDQVNLIVTHLKYSASPPPPHPATNNERSLNSPIFSIYMKQASLVARPCSAKRLYGPTYQLQLNGKIWVGDQKQTEALLN